MKPAKSLDQFFSECEWPEGLNKLREIILSTGIEEGLKWGMPTYMVDGKNVIGLGSFKNHFGIWFHQGVFLSDPKNVLNNAQEGKTIGMRQWRFESEKEIKKSWVKQYVLEAIENQKNGLEIKPKRKQIKKVEIPKELKRAFQNQKSIKASFDKLSPGKQKEVANYIIEAKRQATRDKRVERCIELMKNGQSPMDMYRKN